MEQTKALNALEPFLALTKSASSPRAAAELISQATSHPNTYIFTELLSTPQILALANSPDHASHLTLLRIFSYGTYQDYRNTPNLPALNEAQILKLRQLSFLTLAKSPAALSYEKLLVALGLETPRELEQLVISAIYAGLLSGTLDPYHQLVSVTSVSPLRDLPPNSVPSMLTTLSTWSTRCLSTLQDLEHQILRIKSQALQRHKEEAEWNAHVDSLVEKGDTKSQPKNDPTLISGKRLGQGAAQKRFNNAELDIDDGMDMDADEEDDDRKGPNKKSKGHW